MNKILKNLFIINIVLFGMFFIGVGSADADSECIRCIYSYKEDVVNISETDATTSVAKHAKAQVVVQKKDDGKDASFSIKGICINNANNASAFTEALVGKCNFSNIDELNDSKTLKEHFYKNEKLSCPYMYIVSGGNSLTLHYIDKKPKDFTVDSKKTCDFNNNISAFTPDEKDPLTDGIPDTSSTGDTDYDHEAAKKIINWGKAAKDDKYLGEYSSGCDIIGDDVLVFLNNLFLIIQVIGIILLVFLSSVEFIKVITGSSEDGLSKALKNTLRRVIIVIILLILPLLITWILEIVNDNNYLTDENGKVVIGDDGNPLCRNSYSPGSGGGSGFSDDGGYDSPNADPATSLKYAKVDRISSQKWRGKSIKPTVTVRLAGKKLVLNRDYTVTYKNNNKPGRATITIKGKGKYTGTKKVSFKIEGSDSKVKLDKEILMLDNYHYNISVLEATLSDRKAYSAKDIKWKIEDGDGYSKVVRFYKGSSRMKTTTGKKVKLIGLNFGKAKVTVTLPNGKKATCKIKVFVAPTERIGVINGEEVDYNAGSIKEKYSGLYVMHKHSKGWGDDYVESYINNAEWILKNKPNKFPGESKARTVETYKRADLKVHTDASKRIITSVSGGRWGAFSRSHSGSGWRSYKTIHKKKGELSGNNYVLLHIYKDQWMYLLKKSGGKYKVVNSRRSSGGTRYESFNCYFLDMRYDTHFPTYQTGLTMIGTCYDKTGSAGIQAAHTDYHPKASKQGKPDSNGCLHIGTTRDHSQFKNDHNPTLYYDLFMKAGPGTRLILA